MKLIGMSLPRITTDLQEWSVVPDGYKFTNTKLPPEGSSADPVVSEAVIKTSDIQEIVSNPSNAYTVWAFLKTNAQDPHWENLYAQTYPERLTIKQLFARRGLRAFALLVVPPQGMEPALIFEAELDSAFDGLVLEQIIQQSVSQAFIASCLPTFTLSASALGEDKLTLTATASANISGTEIRWETTGGVIEIDRTTFDGTQTSTVLVKPSVPGNYRARVSYKFYTGIASIDL